MVDDAGRAEDHVLGAAVLAADAVVLQPKLEICGVADGVEGGRPGAAGVEGGGGFSLEPLPAPFLLEVPLADVVDQDVAADRRGGSGFVSQVVAAGAGDDAQLDLPVGVRGAAGNLDRVVGADSRV
jgi:hypothetical protein